MLSRETKRQVVATLIRSGRRDLAEAVARPTVVTAGYSHYWRPPGRPSFTDQQWKELLAGTKKIIAAAQKDGIQVANGLGKGRPKLNNKLIELNGKEPNDYGTFTFTRELEDFASCKTGERPYDAVVVSILALAAKIAPKLVHLSSDGGSVFANPPYRVG